MSVPKASSDDRMDILVVMCDLKESSVRPMGLVDRGGMLLKHESEIGIDEVNTRCVV